MLVVPYDKHSRRPVLKDAGPAAADHSIGCESCHGPGGHHGAAVTAGFSDSAIAGTRTSSAAEINQTCGRCHGFPRWEKLAHCANGTRYHFQHRDVLEQMLFGERWKPELRDLPRPTPERPEIGRDR